MSPSGLRQNSQRRNPRAPLYANQWDNLSNRKRPTFRTTGPEIWEQTDGTIDGFTCSIGTGGTLAGLGIYLKDRKPEVRIAAADPQGAAMYNYYKHGELKGEGSSITEGIGQGRITGNLQDAPIDDAYQIPDEEALPDRIRPALGGRSLPGRFERHQRRRRNPHGA